MRGVSQRRGSRFGYAAAIPEEGTSKVRLQAFGKSLVEFVNRNDPEKSLLLLKPTLRIAHTGGERIRKTSAEEKILRGWISQLAAMPAAEVASAIEYRKREAAGHGEAPTVALRRLTQRSTTIPFAIS